LFYATTALAAIALGWPCQRLNWAWRNVWVTCSINAYTPGSTPSFNHGAVAALGATDFDTAPSGANANVGFLYNPTFIGASLFGQSAAGFMLDANGLFAPGGTAAPNVCIYAQNTGGGNFMRNRCRRMLDVYGNLVAQCATPSPRYLTNGITPDFVPAAGHAPHAANAAKLQLASQSCITPGTPANVPTNTCPGLMGWFTVVWNACQFTNAPSVSTASLPGVMSIPDYVPNQAATTTLVSPGYLCGAVSAPVAPNAFTAGPGVWNQKGGPAGFRGSRCRKSLDQFGRTAARCTPGVSPSITQPGGTAIGTTAQTIGATDSLRYLASAITPIAGPLWCSV